MIVVVSLILFTKRPDIIIGKPSETLANLFVRYGNGEYFAAVHDWLVSPSEQPLCSRFNIDPSRALMVGDRLDTDVLFGHNGKMSTLLVYVADCFAVIAVRCVSD